MTTITVHDAAMCRCTGVCGPDVDPRRSSPVTSTGSTAPTGHAHPLVDANGSYRRDIVRHQAANGGGRIVTPMMRRQGPEQTRVVIVAMHGEGPVGVQRLQAFRDQRQTKAT